MHHKESSDLAELPAASEQREQQQQPATAAEQHGGAHAASKSRILFAGGVDAPPADDCRLHFPDSETAKLPQVWITYARRQASGAPPAPALAVF